MMATSEVPGRTVLLVDDNEMLRRAFVRGASSRGIHVITAEDGVSALNMARGCLPDAIILDLSLPRLDGRDVLTALKRDASTAHIPVVVVSGHCHQAFRTSVLQLGAHDYVEKPFDVRILLRKVLSLIEKSQAEASVAPGDLSESALQERNVRADQTLIRT
jgi:two-component system alkaline phosphatase synthesis response regulator PhoP